MEQVEDDLEQKRLVILKSRFSKILSCCYPILKEQIKVNVFSEKLIGTQSRIVDPENSMLTLKIWLGQLLNHTHTLSNELTHHITLKRFFGPIESGNVIDTILCHQKLTQLGSFLNKED